MSVDFTKLLRNKYPEYDPNHIRYKYGDLVLIDSSGIGILLENYAVDAYIYVIKRSFGLIVGERCRVSYSRIKSVMNSKLTHRILWRSGDLIVDNGIYFRLLEQTDKGWYGICVENATECACYVGSIYYLQNPYEDYIMN